jgi:AMP phosphorylase
MKLKVKEVGLSSGGPLIVVLNLKDAQDLDLNPGDRVSIRRIKLKKEVICVVNVSEKGIRKGEIGLFDESLRKVNVKNGNCVNVEIADTPRAIEYIKKKLEGGSLSPCELNELVRDIVHNEFSESELTYFVSACYSNGLDLKEAAALADAIVVNGERLEFKDRIVVDKHCIGGIPGNRTTMIVVPIISALGYKMPKTSSRSITSPSGTADTMEVLAPVSLGVKKLKKIVNKTKGCIVWGGGINLAAADDKLIKIRHPLRLDPLGMVLASIMAKKKAVGATHVLIDIPFGKGSKIEKKRKALDLKKQFIKMSRLMEMKIRVVLTDGSQPIGNGIGPALECSDVISVLKGKGPHDLREKGIFLCTEILKMLKVSGARKKVLKVLESGKAYEKFKEIILAQGGKRNFRVPRARLFYDVKATKKGKISEIDNKVIAKLARLSGSPEDKTAGMYLRVDRGEDVKKGEILFTLFSENEIKLDTAKNYLKRVKPILY